jgi:hypothetical protein
LAPPLELEYSEAVGGLPPLLDIPLHDLPFRVFAARSDVLILEVQRSLTEVAEAATIMLPTVGSSIRRWERCERRPGTGWLVEVSGRTALSPGRDWSRGASSGHHPAVHRSFRAKFEAVARANTGRASGFDALLRLDPEPE